MFNIQFNFDPTTSEISDLKVVKMDEAKDLATVILEDNKLKLSRSAMELLNITANDRIQINYYTVSPEETFPVIGKSEVFTDAEGGNRVTKSRTVSFRGQQKETLQLYGTSFYLEPFKSYYKMVAVKEETSENDNI